MDSRSGEMQVFTKVVETGSFSGAGKLLNLTPSAVSKLITRLEVRLGVLLFERSTRQLVISGEGGRFYDSCVRILNDIEEAEHDAVGSTAVPSGLLRINTSVPFGTHQLLPIISDFNLLYPDITLDLSLTDALVDLKRERIDVAIRMGPLDDASFRARILGSSRRAVVASPEYLARHGAPKTPDELENHRCFNFNFRRSRDEWPFKLNQQTQYLAVRGDMLTNNGETMRQMTINGLGISRLGMFHIAEDVKAGRLVELLADFNAGDTEDITAIFNNQRYMPQRVRVFIDFLVERIGPLLSSLR
ncbi:LysR family transcriptional regulator [Pseudomonas frederiksbergensis]|jgi:DNA-binding transcriptional LysR family regulator|uniref:LysR family transcriptional regulator n=2 Tax=Pseudomonas frederiksbergensis TaxID=104087 RepID=A0A423JGR9_9PSED|nr:LysR family transcriptional regulator [Pseudomonas frederiksbergensis]